MKKFTAFIFVCCYLLMTKVVFGATIEMDGKTFECPVNGYRRYVCTTGNRKIIVGLTPTGFAAISKENGGPIIAMPVKKVTDDKRVLYQNNQNPVPYEDSAYNRVLTADAAVDILVGLQDDYSKDLMAEVQKIRKDRDNVAKEKLKIVMNSNKENYQCTKGSTRPLKLEQIQFQDKYNTKFTCPFWTCTGKDPAEKVIMLLPKPGNTFNTPNAIVMKNGEAKFFNGDFKIYDGSPLMVTSVPKAYDAEKDPLLPKADVDPDLLIPSKFNSSKSSYNYLMNLAKHDFKDTGGLMDLCADGAIKDYFAEQKKIAEGMQNYLAQAELVEYLKVIDGSIASYYVDRKKGETLGCIYQNKVVDSSVLGQFDHLKEISTLKSSGKYLRPDEVQDLFKKAKNMKDIPFGYKYDGCYARAHIMSKRFETMGIPTQKAWIKGRLFIPGTDIEWQYHVAPTVEVKEKSGKIVNYVIDPSVNDKAVPLDEWVASIGKKTTGPIEKTTYPFPSNGLDFNRTAVAISPVDVYGPMDIPDMTSADKMELSTQKLKEFTEVLASQGK